MESAWGGSEDEDPLSRVTIDDQLTAGQRPKGSTVGTGETPTRFRMTRE